LASTANGITNAHAIGTNYRDDWGKKISVYGSYSFADNTTFTKTTTNQTNSSTVPSTSSSTSSETDNPINHRFTFNLEYRADSLNYLKLTPTFSYASTDTHDQEDVATTRNGAANQAYKLTSVTTSKAPTEGMIFLYNHRFGGSRRNLSIYGTASATQTTSTDNPIYNYTAGSHFSPANQLINSNSHTTSFTGTVSYIEPIGKISYLELNYTYSHSYTTSNKTTDSLNSAGAATYLDTLSNNYKYTFTTNKVGLNYREVGAKYNYILGIGVQPSSLDGQSITTGVSTHAHEFNVIPTARYVYNFSRNESLSANYSGTSSQPSFTQLQPVVDFSNATYPVLGNPDLKPQFTNSFSLRYNSVGIASGNVFFVNASFSQIGNYVATNNITYPIQFNSAVLAAHPELKRLQNTTVVTYLNTNGYYTGSGQFTFSKPWAERKYTLMFGGNVTYANNINYTDSVSTNNVMSPSLRNVQKALTFTPSMRFRLDIQDVVDAQVLTNYAITKATNSLIGDNDNTNTRVLTMGLNGKNYFGDWTFSYDYTKQINSGYASNLHITNPNILSTYVERRFLKANRATVRLGAYDLFNQNSGYTTSALNGTVTESNVNRLGRYYMLSFTLRLQKFAGKLTTTDDSRRGNRGGGRGGNGAFGGRGNGTTGSGTGPNVPGGIPGAGGGGNGGGGNGGGGNGGGGFGGGGNGGGGFGQ